MPKKPSKPALTQELMERLSQEAYCFNAEHDREIDTLKAESEKLKKEHADGVASAVIHKEAALLEKDRIIADLEEKIQTMEGRIEVLESNEAELSDKLQNSMVEAAKKFKDEAKCFDIFHKLIVGQSRETMSVPELFAFAIQLLTNLSPEGPDYRFTVFMDPAIIRYATTAKKALDMKMVKEMGERFKKDKPGFLS